MSQLVALQSAQASSSASPASIDPAAETGDSRDNRRDQAPPMDVDSPTVGRINHLWHSQQASPPGPKFRRPLTSSPLSATDNLTNSSNNTPSISSRSFPLRRTPSSDRVDLTPTPKTKTSPKTHQTAFYSDSSDSGSPEPPSPRPGHPGNANESGSVANPVPSKPTQGSLKSQRPTMAGSVATAQAEPSKIPRNSSIDSAISAMSAKQAVSNTSQDSQQGAPDIASLIKTAGSPEAVIQYLLKEKQSQSQQNGQLWRLVDKQRAMILGLNKDLERALKDKEKYRKKLKEVMAIPAVSRATGAQSGGRTTALPSGPKAPRIDPDRSKELAAAAPDSPTLDSDSQRDSPIDLTMAPYPITPPADHPHGAPSGVEALLDPAHAMPKPQEHALDKFDHEAEDRAADVARKERGDEQLKEIPFNLSLPPSRSLPSEPPKIPPPKPPTGHIPIVSIVEATPQPDEGLAQFPAPPPRKPPPTPLQLGLDRRPGPASAIEDDETDSDYDDILEVDEIMPTDDKRGRRRTREEDDRQREILAIQEAAARSASKKSKASQPESPPEEVPPVIIAVPPPTQPEPGTASIAAVMSGQKPREIPAPLMSPGLPASPRPFGLKGTMSSPPLSPRGGGSFAAPPLSPRPPRQPIPLPPNTPLATPAVANTAAMAEVPLPIRSTNASSRAVMGHAENPAHRGSPTGRTHIYRGLVTEEYPDLLLPPNALPSVQVRVASSRMKPSRASLLSLTQLEEDPVFTLAIISRSDGGELWRVEKDSVSLAKLDQRLKQSASFTARTPERSLFSGHAPAKLDARRIALEQYMDELLNTPFDTATALEVCRYLSTHTLPPNSDETGSSADPTSEGSGNKIGPDGRPLRSGYLTKKGKNFGGWKARFFVLDGPQVKYFECPGGAHLGTIKLPNAQIGKQSQSNENHSPAPTANGGEDLDNQFRHAFLILEPKKKDSNSHIKHVLCAESDRERDLWVDALLQWIDYRDPDDPEPPVPKGVSHDRQSSGGSERQNPGKGKKGANKSYHQQSDSDTLVGVRYDTTQAGDMPDGAPNRPKTSGGLPDQYARSTDNLTAQTNRLISGPKDAQVISDASVWGNKPGLGVPTNDEKKARKRSFFGFGPKTRSSSDGQDSLFGGSEAGSSSTPPQNSYQGPVRQAFGAPLAEAVRYSSPTDISVPLPAVVYRCIQYLDAKNAVLEEGIFRLSGSNVVIKGLRERFNLEGDLNLVTDPQYYDIHAVASLLKLYLRELPTTILTRDLHLAFLSTTELTDRNEKVAALAELVHRLPQANGTLLKYLIAFLIKIINNADINKMTVRNVGIVFSPTLNIPAPVFAMFLQNYEGIFGIEPEEYELPSPISEPESNGQFPDAPPRFDAPARPGTAGSASSPHRQPRQDAIRDYNRTTPTPPLLSNPNARHSPPSGSVSRQGYEPSYPGHQPNTQNAGSRPAYEGGYGAPAGYDAQSLHLSSRAAPGYDRPYQSSHEDLGSASAAYDQSHSASRRRESAVFMGGVVGPQHQGSRSRLREETRF